MAGINKVIIVGHLGNDPEMRVMQNGEQVANISVATSESWTDKNSGEKKLKQNSIALCSIAVKLKFAVNIYRNALKCI